MKIIFITLIVIMIVVITILPVLNFAGVCVGDKKYERAESINRAIDYEISVQDILPAELYAKNVDAEYYRDIYVPYKTRKEFIELNPDCCSFSKLGKKGFEPTYLSRLLGDVNGFIRVEYKKRFDVPNSGVSTYQSVHYYPVSNCGKVWNGYFI